MRGRRRLGCATEPHAASRPACCVTGQGRGGIALGRGRRMGNILSHGLYQDVSCPRLPSGVPWRGSRRPRRCQAPRLPAQARRPSCPGRILTFRLGAEEYAQALLRVQEIRSKEPVTRIANMPGFLKGAVNLRGLVVSHAHAGDCSEAGSFRVAVSTRACCRWHS